MSDPAVSIHEAAQKCLASINELRDTLPEDPEEAFALPRMISELQRTLSEWCESPEGARNAITVFESVALCSAAKHAAIAGSFTRLYHMISAARAVISSTVELKIASRKTIESSTAAQESSLWAKEFDATWDLQDRFETAAEQSGSAEAVLVLGLPIMLRTIHEYILNSRFHWNQTHWYVVDHSTSPHTSQAGHSVDYIDDSLEKSKSHAKELLLSVIHGPKMVEGSSSLSRLETLEDDHFMLDRLAVTMKTRERTLERRRRDHEGSASGYKLFLDNTEERFLGELMSRSEEWANDAAVSIRRYDLYGSSNRTILLPGGNQWPVDQSPSGTSSSLPTLSEGSTAGHESRSRTAYRDRRNKASYLLDAFPYVCTYECCKNGDQLYGTREEWTKHEDLEHRRVWQCFEHESAKYSTKGGLEEHLKSEHEDQLTAQQIHDLVELSAVGCPDTRGTCPFCLGQSPFKHEGLRESIGSHMARHMEEFAWMSVQPSDSWWYEDPKESVG